MCGNPSQHCTRGDGEFLDNEISFVVPKKLKNPGEYFSQNFYAVFLEIRKAVRDPDGIAGSKVCSGYFSEDERGAQQAKFPRNKVFASRID